MAPKYCVRRQAGGAKRGANSMAQEKFPHRIGWIGTGRMGFALAGRLLDAGVDLWAYNRTRSKAEPLAEKGAKIVDSPSDLAERDIVFTMVAGPDDVLDVTIGEEGVLSRGDARPQIIIDATTIDSATSRELTERAAEGGTTVLAAPVSGNPKVVKSGTLTSVVSGPRDAFEVALPYLEVFGRKVTYVGEGDEARLVKICHNLMLGVVTQSMAEITMLAEAAGVSRADFLEFLNDSVMGSTFTRYKTPAFVNLDYTPTFTWHLLRKDFELGLSTGRELDVPLPTAALVHQIVVDGIGRGFGDQDFAALLTRLAEGAGRNIESENKEVSDGLS
ncbi:MAG TPA: NAD(P)-dependent oxidoreductase [Acidimicrobiia bacterium]|nr:NAD(P)-dependent oxidoreductase [Acidimicrobiia bacterium]